MTAEAPRRIDLEKAVPEYAKRFPMEMGILRLGGVYPGEAGEFENPYTGQIDREYFGNVGEHCIAVAYCAETLANRFYDTGSPQGQEAVKGIVKRALVHDATKRFEVMRKIAVKNGVIDDAYSPTAYLTIKPALQKANVTPDVVEYMAHAGSETGHNSLVDFIEIKDGAPILKTKDNLPEMIVHLADDMTYTPIVNAGEKAETSFMTLPERAEAASFKTRYEFMYKEGFGFDKDGKPVVLKDVVTESAGLQHVRTYADWQAWVAKGMAKHLVGLIAPEAPTYDAEKYLKDLVNSTL